MELLLHSRGRLGIRWNVSVATLEEASEHYKNWITTENLSQEDLYEDSGTLSVLGLPVGKVHITGRIFSPSNTKLFDALDIRLSFMRRIDAENVRLEIENQNLKSELAQKNALLEDIAFYLRNLSTDLAVDKVKEIVYKVI